MNPLASKYGAPQLPQVNLVPKDIAEHRAMRRVQTLAALAVVAAIAGLVVVGLGALGAKAVAKSNLDKAFEEEAAAVLERDGKASIYNDYVIQESREITLLQIGWAEIDYAALYASIGAQVNPESTISEIQVFGPSAEGIGGAERHPVDGGGVGTFTLVVQTRTYEEATALTKRLEAVPGLAKVRAESAFYETEAPSTTWETTYSGIITPLVLTTRLTPKDGLIEAAIVDAILSANKNPNAPVVAPPAVEPSVAPSPSPASEG